MSKKILVTGATGTTGNLVVSKLQAQGIATRALVRTVDERSQTLENMGAEVVQGDLLNPHDINKAMKGISRVYFVYPFQDNLPKSAGLIAKAAKANGVDMIVSMSQMNVNLGVSSSPATQNHAIAEDILDWAGVGAVHLRPGLFTKNYLGMAGMSVKSEGKFYFPNAEARYTIIHEDDIADTVVQLLLSTTPEKHTGKRYYLTGPEVHTGASVAATIEKVTGKKVAYVPVPVETWAGVMKNHPYINDFLLEHLTEFSQDLANGAFDQNNNLVEELTGHKAKSFEDYVKEHKADFV